MVIRILDLFGIAVFAVTGALAAGHRKMDVFGMVVVGIVTAVGGGTVRDLVLGIRPVSWVADTVYLPLATVAALVTFLLARKIQFSTSVLLGCDAVGLAVFTVIGCQKAAQVNVSWVIIVLMGMVTGVVGGMMRDVLCGEVPLVLRREIYATASLLGGLLYVLLAGHSVADGWAVTLAAGMVLAVRLPAIYWSLSLPTLTTKDQADDSAL